MNQHYLVSISSEVKAKLGGKRLFFSFHMKEACLNSRLSSNGRIDIFLNRPIGGSSLSLKFIIRIAFLILLPIESVYAGGQSPS